MEEPSIAAFSHRSAHHGSSEASASRHHFVAEFTAIK